jgi:hypothetical protein
MSCKNNAGSTHFACDCVLKQLEDNKVLMREMVVALKVTFSKAQPGVYDGTDTDRSMGCCYVCNQEPKISKLIARAEEEIR